MSLPNSSVPPPARSLPSARTLVIRREHDIAEVPRRDVPQPSSVAIELRRTCWDRLWKVLLQAPPADEAQQLESGPSSEPAETNDAAAGAASRREVTMPVV
jgi:hypothetical protein